MAELSMSSAPCARWMPLCAVALLALTLGGCGAGVRRDAGDDVRAFLAAVARDDAAALEPHLDRKALRRDLKAQLLDVPEVRDLHAQLGVSVGDVSVDRMIAPQAERLAREGPLVALPASFTDKDLKRQLKVVDSRHVCLVDPGVRGLCLLTFAKQGKTWRLVKLQAHDLSLQLPPSSQAAAGSAVPTAGGSAEPE
jgi:hypothetical protein